MSEEYRRAVDKLFELGAKDIILNGNPKHAAALLSTIFKYSKDHVYVFCKNLKAEVFDDLGLLDQISRANQRNVEIHFLLQDGQIESSRMIDFLSSNSNVNIAQFAGILNQNWHFAVADKRAFRMEENHKETSAFGCANRPDIANALERLFFDMEKDSHPIIFTEMA